MHEVKINDDVFRASFLLAVGNRKELASFTASKFPGGSVIPIPYDASGYFQKVIAPNGTVVYYVQLLMCNSLSTVAANLSHECIHVAFASLRDCGIDTDDDELICYYSEFFFHRAYRKVLEKMLKEGSDAEQKDESG